MSADAVVVLAVGALAVTVAVCMAALRSSANALDVARAEKKALEDSIPQERKSAVRKSRAVNAGLITQDIAPLLPDWPFALKDTRPVGAPLDFIVFDGMENDAVTRIVFVEVKSGSSRVSTRQRQIMRAVEEGRVEYRVYTQAHHSPDSEATSQPK